MKKTSKKLPEEILNEDEAPNLLVPKKKLQGFDAKKFCGVIKFKEDAVVLQRRWRDEW